MFDRPAAPSDAAVGIDIVDIDRIRVMLEKRPSRASRLFTALEIDQCEGEWSSLAARYAAKEAVAKILGGLCFVSLTEIETLNGPDGKPTLSLYEGTESRGQKLGFSKWDVSLTHDRGIAGAVVVAF